MATTYHAAIQQMYVAYFNRPADVAGLAYWETVLEANGGDLSVVNATFSQVEEYEDEYEDLDTEETIAKIYQNLFGRAGDAEGMKYWADAIAAGHMTLDVAVDAIANGALTTDKEIIENKVAAATAFTAALKTEAQIAAYDGDEANAAAKEFLAGITDDDSLEEAMEAEALADAVAAVVAAGTPFTLTGAIGTYNEALEAKSEFLASAAEVEAIDDQLTATATDADIEAAIEAYQASTEATIDAFIPGFSGETATLQAAKLAVLQTELAEEKAAATTAATASLKVISDVKGLAAAISMFKAADASAKAAVSVALKAGVAADAAASTFEIENAAVFSTATTATIDGDVVVLLEVDAETGEYSLVSGITEADYAGVTAYMNALNAEVEATAAANAATTAAALAQKTADYFDNADSGAKLKLVSDKMQFVKPEIANSPSAAEIKLEQDMIALKVAPLNAIAVEEGFANYAAALTDLKADLDLAADAAAVATITAAAVSVGFITATEKTAIDAAATAAQDTAESTVLAANNWYTKAAAFATNLVNLDAQELPGAGAEFNSIGLKYEGAYNATTGKQAIVEGIAKEIEELADAVAEYEAASELTEGVADADEAIGDAGQLFVDAKMAAPVLLDVEGTTKLATASADIFVAAGVDATILAAGLQGVDRLYVGTDATYNNAKIGTGTGEIALSKAGNVSVVEFFLEETAGGVEVHIEDKAYGSETGAFVTITLTGVDLADVSVENGFITIA